MIQIENVSFQYNNSEKGALKDVSISVDKGECVLLCGDFYKDAVGHSNVTSPALDQIGIFQ